MVMIASCLLLASAPGRHAGQAGQGFPLVSRTSLHVTAGSIFVPCGLLTFLLYAAVDVTYTDTSVEK